MLTRSSKSVRSIRSIASTEDGLSRVSSDEEIPSFEFQELLPYVCKKFNCSFDIIVKKDLARDDSARYKKVDTAIKFKRTAMLTPTSAQTKIDTKSVPDSPRAIKHKPANFVTVTGLYDTDNRLVEIFLYEQTLVPRMLLQVITVIAPIYENMTKITIRSCSIDAYTVYELNKLVTLNYLTDICLDDSYLPEANYAILLGKDSSLKHLSLCRCHITDEVCKQIVSKLHYLCPAEKNLLILNMSSNRITDEGAACVGRMLRTNRRLRYLNLAGNNIGDDGAKHIVDSLMEFPLTYEEITEKRRRLLNYLKRKRDLIRKFMNECDMASQSLGMISGISSKKSSAYPSLSNLKQRSRNKMLASKLRIVGNKDQAKEIAEMLAVDFLGQLDDPINFHNIVVKEGWSYCTGNSVLSYLNLSYNNLTHVSTKKILDVLLYQSCDETGLFKIVLEGNCMPESMIEYREIDELINKKINVHVMKTATTRRKSHVGGSKASTPGVSRKSYV